MFDFLEGNPSCVIERREFYSAVFAQLRRNLRSIVVRIGEAEFGEMGASIDRIRIVLSEWLTAPVAFDGALLEILQSFGDADAVETRWGPDVCSAYKLACAAATDVLSLENPLRSDLSKILRHLSAQGSRWRIHCHKRARIHFESLREPSWPHDCFIHSIRDYRETAPFDFLLKIGPLRSRGWSAAPDAILSAPRYTNLIQFVWFGCADEEGFGYDPVGPSRTSNSSNFSVHGAVHGTQWSRRDVRIGEREAQINADEIFDELKLFAEVPRSRGFRRATLVDIDEEHGILYPPHSQVASFDPAVPTESPFGFRVPGETLLEGMFIVRPMLADTDLGGLHATDGYYSRTWKEHLRKELLLDAQDLVRRLKSEGLNLLHILPRVRGWCRPPSTVIHAPQQKRHFEILIRVLGINNGNQPPTHLPHREWWQSAWTEIAHSRAEAIQTGLQENDIVNEELFSLLRKLLPELRSKAEDHSGFELPIPVGCGLNGAVRFHFVRSIEEGFLVPENILCTICDLETIEQWRD